MRIQHGRTASPGPREVPELLSRRVATRRSLLTGAAGIAAGAGIVVVGSAAPASAQSDAPGPPSYFNVVDYGATGNGTTDDTAAIQAAIAACAAAGGGVVYFPSGASGTYRITSTLSWTSSDPVVFMGDTTEGTVGPITGGSAIHLDAASPVNAIAVTNPDVATSNSTGSFTLSELDVIVDGDNTSGTSIEYSAVYCENQHTVTINKCFVGKGNGNYSVNTAFHLANCLGSLVQGCYVTAESQAVWFNGGAGCTVADSYLTTTDGNGYGGIRMDGDAGTLHIRNSTTFRGDHGLIMTQASGTTDVPAFVFINDFEVNNPAVSGLELDYGSQAWIEQYWATGTAESPSTVRHGLVVGPDFAGFLYLHDSSFGGMSGYGMWIQGGYGYVISNCSFGNDGDNAANTYDDLHIASAASNVTVTGCHFDTDKYNQFATNPVRSSIYIESGSTGNSITGNSFAPSGYGTAPVMDLSDSASASGNLNWKPALQRDSGGQTVTGTSYADLSGTFTIGAYEATTTTLYRLVAWGTGTQASGTAADLSIQATLGSSTFIYTIMDGTSIGAGDAFHWRATIDFLITSTGGSAGISPGMTFTWSRAIGTTTANAATASGTGDTTFNSETANSVTFQAEWSTTTGSPTISCAGSYLECVTA
jgi:polygalacturonase